jgi:hypothetical protein
VTGGGDEERVRRKEVSLKERKEEKEYIYIYIYIYKEALLN